MDNQLLFYCRDVRVVLRSKPKQMKSKVILCIALGFYLGWLGDLSIAAPVPAAEWQASLRAAITNEGSLPPFGSIGIIHLTVPAKAGKILENEPKADLLPFLAKLRAGPPSWKAGIVDTWTFIVRNGLHGIPMVITNSVMMPGGKTVLQKEIAVYCYTFHYSPQSTNAAPHQPAVPNRKRTP